MSRDPSMIAAGIRVLEHYKAVELKKLEQARKQSEASRTSSTRPIFSSR